MKKLIFKENLKRLRLDKGYTQKQLGEKLCIDQRSISAWEKGICEPSFEMLLKICEIFNENADEILFE